MNQRKRRLFWIRLMNRGTGMLLSQTTTLSTKTTKQCLQAGCRLRNSKNIREIGLLMWLRPDCRALFRMKM